MNECQRAIYLCRVFGNFVLSKSSVINCHGVQDQSKQNDRQTFTGLAHKYGDGASLGLGSKARAHR